jgi:UTP--glucose-1-phosphate uridylyltransferase
VQPTKENLISMFGVVGAGRIQGQQQLYKIERVIEKPTPTEAEQKLLVPGLRGGHYLCFYGMHILTDSVMQIIEQLIEDNPTNKVNLSDALNILASKEEYLALEQNDLRFDLGTKYGLFKAQLAVALSGKDRDRIMSEILEFFVSRELNSIGK